MAYSRRSTSSVGQDEQFTAIVLITVTTDISVILSLYVINVMFVIAVMYVTTVILVDTVIYADIVICVYTVVFVMSVMYLNAVVPIISVMSAIYLVSVRHGGFSCGISNRCSSIHAQSQPSLSSASSSYFVVDSCSDRVTLFGAMLQLRLSPLVTVINWSYRLGFA